MSMAAVVEEPISLESLKEMIERSRMKAEVASECIASYFERPTFERLTSTQIREILPDIKKLKMYVEDLEKSVEAYENLGRDL